MTGPPFDTRSGVPFHPRSTAEIRSSKLLGVLSFVVCAIMLGMGVILWDSAHGKQQVLGAVFIGVFGPLAVLIVRSVTRYSGVIVKLSADGIRDIRLAADTIPWNAILSVETWSRPFRFSIVVLNVRPEVESTLDLKTTAGWFRGSRRTAGADGLCIAAHDLEIGFYDLKDLIDTYWENYREADGRAS